MPRTTAAFLALAPLLWAPAAAQASGPRETVQETVDAVLVVLQNPALSSPERRGAVEEIAYARFDFTTMSRLVLARNWKRFSDEQKESFQEEFKRLLAKEYGRRLDSYNQEQVEVLGEREEPRGDVTVRTRIVGGDFEGADVDYRMRKSKKGDAEWRVIDVTVEGISLVSNYRDQFKSVMARGGPEKLLEEMRKKNSSPAQEA